MRSVRGGYKLLILFRRALSINSGPTLAKYKVHILADDSAAGNVASVPAGGFYTIWPGLDPLSDV